MLFPGLFFPNTILHFLGVYQWSDLTGTVVGVRGEESNCGVLCSA